jgi:hypothetical protein
MTVIQRDPYLIIMIVMDVVNVNVVLGFTTSPK